ncbi:hypothetical protein MMC17_003312 [Xylographa soralifera]|nr:hypothetical protein [Xylographa soralifera]
MASIKTSRIVQLAEAIRIHTAKLDMYITSCGLPSLSFDEEFPSLPAEMEGSRISILEATDEMTDLMLGARKLAECDPPQHTSLLGIQAIRRYSIASKVGIDEEVAFTELAERCKLPADDLRRLLRQAMSRHIFKEPRKGYVAHTAASRIFAESRGINDWVYMALDEIWPSAAHMLDAMDKWPGSEEAHETGFNLAKATKDSFFESMEDNPNKRDAFANVMSYAQSRQGIGFSVSHLLSSYDWASVRTVVDVGGGTGTTCTDLARNFPSIHCIVQDMPEVVAQGRAQLASDVASQITFMAHDFFQEQPIKDADVYFMRWILHDWSDKKAVSILKNLVPALKHGANIVLQEFVIPEPGVLSFYHEKLIRCLDLAMKAGFNSKEREIEDWVRLFINADYRFKFVGAKVPPGSNLATIHARWEEATPHISADIPNGDN